MTTTLIHDKLCIVITEIGVAARPGGVVGMEVGSMWYWILAIGSGLFAAI